MPHLKNSIPPKELLSPFTKNLNKKEKMPEKEEKLTTEQQLKELLAAKQQAEAEENKRKKREYTFYLWASLVFFLIFGTLSLGLKSAHIYNEHIVKNHSFWIILKDFIIPADYNFAFYALLFASLFFFWGFFYVRK